jgi:predicted XRE-type DNA-binding protein
MTENDDFELVRGSGNIFRDFNDPNAELEQFRAMLAVRIIKALDKQKLTGQEAAKRTGFAEADFSRIRRANLGRFTIDRLMMMLTKLGQDIEVTVKDRPAAKRPKARAQTSARNDRHAAA